MKKIYITGIAGLLGGNIAYLLRDKYIVSGVDLIKVNIPGVSAECFDITEYEKLKKAIESSKADIVVHCAAFINVDACEERQKYAYRLNYEVTDFITDLCSEKGIKLIYISTDAVFDGNKPGLYTESDIPNPVNIYGLSKLKGEQSVYKTKNNLILRTNIYGWNIQDKYSFGEWVFNSLLEGKNLNMFKDVYYSPILVNDLAYIIDALITIDASGLYHVCATGSISKYDFGISLKDIFNLQSGNISCTSVDDYNFKAVRSKNMGMDNSKLTKLLGKNIRNPKESIEEFKKLCAEGYSYKLKECKL